MDEQPHTETGDPTGVAAEVAAAFEEAGVDYVVFGAWAMAAMGSERQTKDVDFLVRQRDAKRALEVLGARGFSTDQLDDNWIYKAFKNNVQIDVIFWVSGDLKLDDEMLKRANELPLGGHNVKVIPPEDMFVIKAIVYDRFSQRHLFDALAVLRQDLDWNYLLQRARHSPRRVLAFLILGQAFDLPVPDRAIKALTALVYA